MEEPTAKVRRISYRRRLRDVEKRLTLLNLHVVRYVSALMKLVTQLYYKIKPNPGTHRDANMHAYYVSYTSSSTNTIRNHLHTHSCAHVSTTYMCTYRPYIYNLKTRTSGRPAGGESFQCQQLKVLGVYPVLKDVSIAGIPKTD